MRINSIIWSFNKVKIIENYNYYELCQNVPVPICNNKYYDTFVINKIYIRL